MIVRDKPSFWQLFGIFRLSILPRIASQLLAVGLFAGCVVGVTPWLRAHRLPAYLGWTVAPFTLLGIALSIFLGFRNNACYDRWWEARRQLGALIGDMRSFARLLVTLPGVAPERRQRVLHTTIGYVYALMSHLRDVDPSLELSRYAPDYRKGTEHNTPDRLLREVGSECADMLATGEVSDILFVALDQRLTSFAAYQVACERIKATPTPFPYTLLLHRTAYAYCFLLPFGLVTTMGWGTPLFCVLVAYAFFGLDALGDELEEPFGPSLNALPLLAMARTMEISLLEALGAAEIPAPLQPVAGVLS